MVVSRVVGVGVRVIHEMTECVAVGSESDEVLTNLNAACFGLLITEKLLSTVLGSDLFRATYSRKS